MNYFFLLKQIYWIVPLSFKQIFFVNSIFNYVYNK